MVARCPTCGAGLAPGATCCTVCGKTLPGTALTPIPAPHAVGSPISKSIGSLICQTGADAGKQIPLFPQTVTLGRESTCDFVLTDTRASRQHACLEWRGSEFVLIDMNSTNGTRLNYQPLTSARALKSGDRILIGSTVLLFQLDALANRPPVPGAPVPSGAGLPHQRAPEIEGRIEFIDGPYMERGNMMGPAALGAVGYLINPALGIFGSLMASQRGQIPVRYLRIQDRLSGRIRSAKMRGEPSGLVSVGDEVQLWGCSVSGSGLEVQLIYNQTTDEIIKLKV